MKGTALSFREKLGYDMGDAGCNMIGGAIMIFLNYFYTNVFGLVLIAPKPLPRNREKSNELA